MDWQFPPTTYWACDYFSIQGLKLNHFNKRGLDGWNDNSIHTAFFFSFTLEQRHPTIHKIGFYNDGANLKCMNTQRHIHRQTHIHMHTYLQLWMYQHIYINRIAGQNYIVAASVSSLPFYTPRNTRRSCLILNNNYYDGPHNWLDRKCRCRHFTYLTQPILYHAKYTSGNLLLRQIN